jgi:hypothetical protein
MTTEAVRPSGGARQFAGTVRPHIPEKENKLTDGKYSVIP